MIRRALYAGAFASLLVSCAPSVHAPRVAAPLPVSTAPRPIDTPPPAPAYAPRETPDAPFRANAPPLAATTPFTAPAIRSFRLGNGVRVLFLEQHASGFVRVELMLRAQAAPLGANATAERGVWLGTVDRQQTQLQSATDADMAEMATSYGWGWIHVSMTAPSARASSSIARLADTTLNPAFPADQVVRITRDAAHDKEASENTPRELTARALAMVLDGGAAAVDDWAVLRSTDLGALRRDDIAQAYQAALDPSGAALLVIGDTTEESVRPILEKSFGAWRSHGKGRSKPASPPVPATSARVIFVQHPDTQAQITFAGEGPVYGSPDWAPSLVLSTLFGGPKGRAKAAIHEPGILEYGPRPAAPHTGFSVKVSAARAGETIAEVVRAMRAMKTAEIAPGELDAARRSYVLGSEAWAATLAGATNVMGGLIVQRLPPEDVSKRAARLLAVTPDDVHRVAARYLDPDRMKIVVVGDASAPS